MLAESLFHPGRLGSGSWGASMGAGDSQGSCRFSALPVWLQIKAE